MGNRDLRAILRLLRDCGVTRFKNADLEVTLDPNYRPVDKRIDSPINDPLLDDRGGKLALTSDEPADPLALLFFHEGVQ